MSAPCPWPRGARTRRPFPWGATLIVVAAIFVIYGTGVYIGYGIGRASIAWRLHFLRDEIRDKINAHDVSIIDVLNNRSE